MRARPRTTRWISASIATAVTSVIWLAGVGAAGADPPGNNGTVKVAGEDADGGNDAHVGCSFAVDLFGYDEGAFFAYLTLEGQQPTGGGTLWTTSAFIGEDPAGGANDFDASVPIDLAGVFDGIPHGEQGFHVKLTVHADGSQGADVKHKTLWVDCDSGGEGEGEGGGEGEAG